MVHFSNFTSTEMAVEYVQETFRWPLRETLAQRPRPLSDDHLILCVSFDLGVATRYAQDSNISEMVQAIFHAIVVNENLDGVLDMCPAAAALGSFRVLVREHQVQAQTRLALSRGTSSSSSDSSSRHSSSEGASTSLSSHEGPSTLGKSVLKRKDRSPVEQIPEIIVEGPEFLGAPAHSDPQDGPGSHFPDPKVVPTLKRTAHEKQYFLPAGYTF
ncbi:hypothetical protein Cgig2_008018 [Carnegiea gigantea]|uniref:Uncharacterized protein n=1 Tax=Carnegiea gigantea TaxID=171969 RepID=A0A9Q1QT30_9CARY|nr:hypothetical protein Cgig2_008018 [Carnegiea gigantea]